MSRNPACSRGGTHFRCDSSGSGKSLSTCKSCNTNASKSSKILPKNQPQKCRNETKSISTVIALNNTTLAQKTTKSDLTLSHKVAYNRQSLDICKKCGDADWTMSKNERQNTGQTKLNVEKTRGNRNDNFTITPTNGKYVNKITNNGEIKPNFDKNKCLSSTRTPLKSQIQVSNTHAQPFKNNNNYKSVFDSSLMEDAIKRIKLLDTISELPEIQTVVESSSSANTKVFRIYSETSSKETSDDLGSNSVSEEKRFDAGDAETLRRIKEFRDKNYYECHSSIRSSFTKIDSKGSENILRERKDVCSLEMSKAATSRNKFTVPSSSLGSIKSVSTSKSGKSNTSKSFKGLSKNQPQNCRKVLKSLAVDNSANNTKKSTTIPKKTTKSELVMSRKTANSEKVNICTKCGDSGRLLVKSCADKMCRNKSNDCKTAEKNRKHFNTFQYNGKNKYIAKNKSITSKRESLNHSQPQISVKQSSVKEFYKNENFEVRSDHFIIEDKIKKIKSLDTIAEAPEIQTMVEDSSSEDVKFFKVYSQASDYIGSKLESELGSVDDNSDYLKRIREFRDENYFECHSSKTRLRSKGSVTSLEDHKCVFRFYLNERLFPEPLDTDTTRKIRCVDCHLPLELDDTSKCDTTNDADLNGTIQAKVKIGAGDQAQDTIVMLPVNKSLIIREKKREPKKLSDEEIYFGVIKLGQDGQSVFKENFKSDSLALKYQKGFKEFRKEEELRYDNAGGGDVIFV